MLTLEQKTILDILEENTHAFMTAAFVDKVAHAFDIELRPARVEANPQELKGLRLDNGAKSAVGLGADTIAMVLAHKLGATYLEAFGRGTTVHRAVDAIRTKLESE